ncbi:hypothetical protein Tco_0070845 [Tanacetum coccineum]
MGELWVLLEFGSKDSIKLFQDNVSIGSWFSQLKQANMEFNIEGRIAWVEVEGVPFKLWSDNTFNRIATKWGELLDSDDQNEMCFHSKRLCIYTKTKKNIFEEFKIIFRDKVFWIRAKEAPGWVPDFTDENDDEELNDEVSKEGELKIHEAGSCGEDSEVEEVMETIFEGSGQKNNLDKEHTDQKENYSEDPFDIYKMLNKKEVIVKNERGIESRNDHTVKLSDRITKEVNNAFSGNGSNNKSKEDVSGSVCSGRFKKSEVPRTGGSLLSLMDELVKVSQVMGYKMEGCLAQKAKKDWVKELCVKHKVNFLALQETKMERMELFSVKMCWGNLIFDFVHSDSVGEVVIMGDFNEVWYKSDRFGSEFNVRGANVFNSFISSAGLEEIREWNKENMLNMKNVKAKHKEELEALEEIIDKGNGNEVVVNKRMEVVNTLQKIDKIHSFEMAQKAKADLERDVSNKEIKRAVWDCGTDKSPVHVLECFYRASGLRINMSKSKIMGIHVVSDKVKSAATKLGCLILKTPFLYLGSKVGGSMSRVQAWTEVVDRVKSRLSKWKMKALSIGGSTEVIEQTYERLQKLISQLEMHGEVISQEDINQKFLRNLS